MNPILLTGAVAWLLSQVSKAIIYLIINKRFQWDRLFGDGGMPSSHSATVTSVAVITGLRCGLDSPIFAIAAILLAVFFVAMPTGKTEMMTRTISNINNGLLFGMMSKDTNTSKIEISKTDTQKPTNKADTIIKLQKIKAEEQTVKAEPEKKGYCIVLASQVSKRNAELFIERLKGKGLDSAEICTTNKTQVIRRVICGNFKTQEEAYKALRNIHKDEELKDAWVYKLN